MFRSKVIPAALAAVLVLGGGAGIAQARDNERDGGNAQERAAILNAKTSIAQAVATAEQETGGKAIDTGVENQDGNIALEVRVAKDNVVQKVLIDPQTGKVVKVVADDDGEHGDNGHEHEN